MSNVIEKTKPFSASIFVIILLYLSSFSLTAANALEQDPEKISWHISAAKVTYDNKKKLYIAQKDVIITGGKTRLEADYIEFSNKTKDAFAQGNVLLISGEDSISCNAMNINLASQTGTVNKGIIYIQKNNFYIHGENIRKTGKFTYSANKGSITSCAGDSPDWKITGDKIEVTVEGYGTAVNTVLWARNVPALYSPYLVFPVKAKRQTGLLTPRITTSDRKGIEFEQPLFIAISRNTDATIYTDFMSDRGTKLAGEYRYILNDTDKGTLLFDCLEDKKTDDGSDSTQNMLYSFSETPQRTNKDRFWFRMKHNHQADNGFTAKLDIDFVSDADYLHEFKDGFTGYEDTKDYFEKEFDRGIDEYDDTIRKNWFNLRKQWDNYTFNVDALWYDNITARRQNTDDTTLQTLPAIQFDASRTHFLNTGLYYSLDSELRSFYRKDTTATQVKGQRSDIHPRFYYPLKLGKSFYFEPYIGLRSTVWHTSDYTDANRNDDNIRTREMYDAGAELSTKIIKIFSPENQFADRLKHEIIPKLEYDFVPYISQNEFPSFDDIDRIEEANLLTWSVTQNFITRKDPQGFDSEKKNPVYKDIAYLKIAQSYDIKKERDNESRPFSSIMIESEYRPSPYLSLAADLHWSPYDSHVKEWAAASAIRDKRGDYLNAEYRYRIETTESLYAIANIALTDEISTYCSIEKNMLTQKTIEITAGLKVRKPCWTFSLFFAEASAEKSIAFLVNLHGIGEFGTK